jgi:HD-GYP domain-containing protein (c-di-GMP phosphodiesterase class II)
MGMVQNSHEKALQMAYVGSLPRYGEGFFRVPSNIFSDNLEVNLPTLPPITIHVLREGKPALLRKSDEPFPSLALASFDFILVHEDDIKDLQQFAEQQILTPSATTSDGKNVVSPQHRMEVLHNSATELFDNIFKSPTLENLDKGVRVVSTFVSLLMKDAPSYVLLSTLLSHDEYTIQHSVGTAVNSIILARKFGVMDIEALREIGMAGLLHDVGKNRIAKQTLNKRGKLNDEEWKEMQKHSQWSYDIVRDHPKATDRVKHSILDHHEKKNGSGYPRGLSDDEIEAFARIVGICDIYNALTTTRPYSEKRAPFEALKFMSEKMKPEIDMELFKNLVLIFGGNLG